MPYNDAIDLMLRCKDEIQHLRRINAELAPKADAYDALRQVLDLMPRRPIAMTEDVVWRLDKAIAELRQPQADHPVSDTLDASQEG